MTEVFLCPFIYFQSTFHALYFHILHLAEQVRSKDKVIQPFIGRSKDIIFRSFPFLVSLININHFLPNPQHRVHIMGIDNSRHIILLSNVMNEIIDN